VKLLEKLRKHRHKKSEETVKMEDPIAMGFGDSVEVPNITVVVNATGIPIRIRIHGNVLTLSKEKSK